MNDEDTEVQIDKYDEHTTLSEVILEAKKLCRREGIEYDPFSVIIYADYDGHTFINLAEGLRGKGEG